MSVFVSTDMSLFLIFLSSSSPVDLPMSDRNFDARSSAAVIASNSQIFSTFRIHFHTSADDSPFPLFRSKKSALLCCTFLSGVTCSRNSVYSLCNGSELGSFSLTVFVISVIAVCPIVHRIMSFFLVPVDHGIVTVFLCCSS